MNNQERKPQYEIGQQFKTRGKHPKICTIVDIYTTRNGKGELVHFRYVATHEFMGQIMTDCDIPEATVSMGLIK
jgi:hypothetical protein